VLDGVKQAVAVFALDVELVGFAHDGPLEISRGLDYRRPRLQRLGSA
jgi:hypothetical protein